MEKANLHLENLDEIHATSMGNWNLDWQNTSGNLKMVIIVAVSGCLLLTVVMIIWRTKANTLPGLVISVIRRRVGRNADQTNQSEEAEMQAMSQTVA